MEHHIVLYDEIVEWKATEAREKRVKSTQGEGSKVEDSATQERDHLKEYYEQKKKVTKPVSLEEFFKPRSLKPGDPKNEIRRVLLCGNAGSGKTCISKVIAHKWALGEIMREFEVVYVIPIRYANIAKSKDLQGVTLKDVVAQVCFEKESAGEYEDLLTQVEGDLDSPFTLLVFDGLDEASEHTRELVHKAAKHSCRLIILTRSYNLQLIRMSVDLELECLGFNDQQLKNYIRKELLEDEASRLINSLQENRGLWETAHTPVIAHILCSLSKERSTGIEAQIKRTSTFQIYRDMTSFLWKRFKDKPRATEANKDVVFGDLEKIAFVALQNEKTLIEESIVENQTTSTNTTAIFKESGFLLFVLKEQRYQFPHFTFQEYFAGRFIAKGFESKGSNEEKKALEFIQEEKYNQKHDLTMYFAMHTFAEGRKKDALQDMLSVINDQPVEVLGVQHFFLKMRVLEAILQETDEKDMDDLLHDKQAIKLAEGAQQLLERTIDDVLIREIVSEKFQYLSCVMERFPQVLEQTIDNAKKRLAREQNLRWADIARIADVLKLEKHAQKQSYGTSQFISQIVREAGNWCNPMESITRFDFIAEQMPQHAGELLPAMVSRCTDEIWEVRQAAMEAIGRVVAAGTLHDGDHMTALVKGCTDEPWEVRQAAMKAISLVVAARSENAHELLGTLIEKCTDEDPRVRQAMMEAIDHVVVEGLQQASNLLNTLKSICNDKDWKVRRVTMEAIGRVVAAKPEHVHDFLSTLEEGCNDKDFIVRQEAIEIIGRVIPGIPQVGCGVLLTLANKCTDDIWEVRQAAMEAIGRVVAAGTLHDGDHMTALVKGCTDKTWEVRQAAMKAISLVVAARSEHAHGLLETLAMGCIDKDWRVRRTSIETVDRVITAKPRHAGDLLLMLTRGCSDKDWRVREAAMKAVENVVAVGPQHIEDFWPRLIGECDDNWRVRRGMMDVIARIVEAVPHHISDILFTLTNGCSDEIWEVRQAAVKAIGCVIANDAHPTNDIVQALERLCTDKFWRVRQEMIHTIVLCVTAAPQYAANLLPILEKMCSDEDVDVRRVAIGAIDQYVMAAPQHAVELLRILATGCSDQVPDMRKAAIEAIGRCAAAALEHVADLMLILTTNCDDKESDVRLATFKTLVRVVEAEPQHTGDLVSTLAKGCVDEDLRVRQTSREAVDHVITIRPQHTGDLVSTLVMKVWYSDTDWRMRREAMTTIGRVVMARPLDTLGIFLTLASWSKDEDPIVRRVALGAIRSVVVVEPQHDADFLLSLLTERCYDNNPDVRQAALEVIDQVVPESPQFAKNLLSTLAIVSDDNDSNIRRAAFEVIDRVVTTTQQFAGDLTTLARGCIDEDFDVRNHARNALNSIKPGKIVVLAMSIFPEYKLDLLFLFVQHPYTFDPRKKNETDPVPFVLHTTSSQKVGRWRKADTDQYVGFLRQEFDEKFPGLLDHLETKE